MLDQQNHTLIDIKQHQHLMQQYKMIQNQINFYAFRQVSSQHLEKSIKLYQQAELQHFYQAYQQALRSAVQSLSLNEYSDYSSETRSALN